MREGTTAKLHIHIIKKSHFKQVLLLDQDTKKATHYQPDLSHNKMTYSFRFCSQLIYNEVN